MAAGQRCWTLVPLLVLLVLVLVTVVSGAGPLAAALRVTSTASLTVTKPALGSNFSTTTSAPRISSETTSTLATTPTSYRSSSISTSAPNTSSGSTSTLATTPASDNSSSTSTLAPGTTSEVTSTLAPCTDPHADKNAEGDCKCSPNYQATSDPQRSENNTCRVKQGGYLGNRCYDVSECNYAIHHVACQVFCQCIDPYMGFNGDTTCFDNAMGWNVAIKTAGITVLVLAVGFFIAFGIKGCSRTIRNRLGRRVPWLRRTSDISFQSGDFYVGSQAAILDRPPSYAEEDTDKPPAYEEVFPEHEQQDGVVNAGFSPDSTPGSPEQRQRQQAALEASAPSLPEVQVLPARAAPHGPARRGHRRGLSGPAAIHLGTAEQGDGTCRPEQGGTAAPGQGGIAAHEQTSTAAPEQASTAALGQTSTAASRQTSTAAPEQTSTAATKQTSTAAPGQTSTAATGQTSTAAPGPTSTAAPGQTSTAATGQTSTAASQQTSTAAPEQTSTAAPGQTSTAAPGQTSSGSTAAPEQTSTAATGQTSTAASQQTSTAAPGQTSTAASQQTSTAAPEQTSGARDVNQAAGTSAVAQTAEVDVNVAAEVSDHPPTSVVVCEGQQSVVAGQREPNPQSAQHHTGRQRAQTSQRAQPADPAEKGPTAAERGHTAAEPAQIWEDVPL